ncbi:hypothetical protein OAR23_02255 [bacterium]|jgi:hypothetical protein|nr:hypothetical protein [bacterium]|tara:strand:+ start:1268 stop:1567 length:300 start_codon:yes stop_codon:yes gene_type:complete
MSVDTKYGEAIFKQTQEVAEMFKSAMPKITTNKNGYEIRAEVLKLASVSVWKDYYAKWDGYTFSKEGDKVKIQIDAPVVPGTEEVLEAAEKFYAFINQK